MISLLIQILKNKKLSFNIIEQNSKAIIFEFNVTAKPAAKVDKVSVGSDGAITIQTRAKPVDGEANEAIILKVAEVMGVSKSQVEIVRGDKSKIKRIKILMEITANKDVHYFETKLANL